MKRCAICGQAAERGAFCADCKAALKRARDETISQFQPASVLAGVGLSSGASSGASSGDRRRTEAPAARRATELPADPGSRAAVPQASRDGSPKPAKASPATSRFVWLIVTLMVMGGAYVLYAVIHTGIESARTTVLPPPETAAPAPASGQAVPLAPTRERPLDVGLPPAAPTDSAPVVGSAQTSQPLPTPRARPPTRHAATRNASTVAGDPKPAPTAPMQAPPADVRPATSQAVVPAAGKVGVPPRSERWERMDAALRACGNEAFLGRVLCEQKVRLHFCEGRWGESDRCPGNSAYNYGQ